MPRCSCTYKITGTKTFRLASTSILGKWGTNMANWEKSIRRLFIPDTNKVFIQVDQSGAEALIVAYLCKPGNMLRKLFDNKIKPHTYLGLKFPQQWIEKFPSVKELATLDLPDLKQHKDWPALAKAIADSDNNPAATRFYYHYKQTCHCVDEKTEVLTKSGWKSIGSVLENEEIATFDLNQNIKFEVPSKWNKYNYTGKLLKFRENELNQAVTPNHRMLFKNNDKIDVEVASYVRHLSTRIPNSGYYNGGSVNLKTEEAQLLVAIQADANIQSPRQCRFHFIKQRKIDRLRSLCQKLNLNYDFIPDNSTHKDAWWIVVKDIEHLLKYFVPTKVWDSWLLSFTPQTLDTIINELSFWDGSYTESYMHKREVYRTAIEKNAEWIKTILHLRGKQGTVAQIVDKNNYTMYHIGINKRQFARLKSSVKESEYSGMVYCPTVSTGAFLVRRFGKISATGNSSNYGIGPSTFQTNILDKSGGKVVLTHSQAKAYLDGYNEMIPELREWHSEVRNQLYETNYLFNLFGYPFYFNTVNDSMFKEAYAVVPQSTVGCITHNAYIYMQEYIEGHNLDWDILANTHDSYLIQVPDEPDEINHCVAYAQMFMNQELTSPRGEKFRMKSEAQVGRNWSPMDDKREKNPDGLTSVENYLKIYHNV